MTYLSHDQCCIEKFLLLTNFDFFNRTATGVENFKKGNHEKALKYLNHALQIYEENPEALVARGALLDI